MFCKNCGNQVPEGSAFCNNCGAPQSAPAPQPAPVLEQPAPVVEPTPVVEQPAPVAPAPVVEQPAPVVAPAPVVEQPAPVAPQPVPAEVPVAPAPVAPQNMGYAPAPQPAPIPQPAPAPAKKSHKGLIITIVIVLVIAILAGTGWVLYDNGVFDDLFGSSSSASSEDKDEDESKDDSSSNNQSQPADPNGTTSEDGVNSELNQGTPVTPPTTSAPSAAAYTAGYIDENGNYMNPWANLQYRVGEYQVATNPGVIAEDGSEMGIMVMGESGSNISISFIDNTTLGYQNETAYLNDLLEQSQTAYDNLNMSFTYQPITSTITAGEQYTSTLLTVSAANNVTFLQSILVRKIDNHFVLITISGQNQLALNTMGNRLHSIS